MKNSRKRTKICLSAGFIILTFILIICALYVADYYHTDTSAVTAFSYSENISIQELSEDIIVYSTEDAKTGFIFYPGGKVEYTAYEPLMLACAENDILCVLIEMPFNLAVLDINAADEVIEQFPEIENWYIGGHSLGGSMAASYVSKNTDHFDGLILLGSYSTANLSNTHLEVLSIYGSEDMVLNQEKYEKYSSNLPDDFTEYEIEGGCHAYFGMYGEQDGDGTPSITNEEQIYITADKVAQVILE